MKYWKTKYQVAEDLYIDIPYWPYGHIETDFIVVKPDNEGGALMLIKKYWCFDGPSGPAIDTPNFMEPSAAHDALYWLIRWGLIPMSYRKYADKLMYNLCLKKGMWKIRAKWCLKAVRKFAESAASPENKRPILTAP